jgi:hypothetical protein
MRAALLALLAATSFGCSPSTSPTVGCSCALVNDGFGECCPCGSGAGVAQCESFNRPDARADTPADANADAGVDAFGDGSSDG